MDEGAGDQLDNSSNLQEQEKNEQSSSSHQQQKQQQQSNSNDQQQSPQHQQQQQPPLSSSSTSSLTTTTTTTTNKQQSNDSSAIKQQQQHSSEEPHDKAIKPSNPSEDLFSTKRWGVTPIRQDTPWELPPSPTQTKTTSSLATGGVAGGIGGPTLPPGISQSGDSFRSSATSGSVNDFGHAGPGMVNNFGVDSMTANGLANSLGHMGSGGGANVLHSSSRFDQPWRAPAAKQQHQQSSMTSSSPYANHNSMNQAPSSMQKSMLNSTGGGVNITGNGGNGGSPFVGMQQGGGGEFARAPGPASSIMDNNMTAKPFGMANRSSTWSAFGSPAQNDSEPEWPKTTTSGISASNPTQPSNAFDLVPEFEPGKPWHGSMLMKSLDDESSMNTNSAGISAFAGAYAASSKSPTGSQYEPSGIGTWSPIVKGGRPGSKWDGDGPGDGRGDNGRFDDGTAIWGSPAQNNKCDWVEKTGDPNSNNDKSRSMAGNNQSYRPQQQQQQQQSSSSSTSLLMSSNTSPSSQHSRSQQQTLKQPSLSHSFDQVQQQSNALSSQANQPNRGLGLSSNVPSTQQLKHMVQQIQLAVHAGHLNPQILNQPLAPVTLQLLYQLLQQIKILHQLQMQASQQQFSKPGNHPAAVNVHITKTKQNILNLQNQIAAQQAVYLKQTQAHNISSRQPTMPNLATGGVGGGIGGPALPPGISQSGDSFRSSTTSGSVNDFGHAGPGMVNNFGVDSMTANGLANSLGHMSLGGANVLHSSSRFDQPWRAPAAKQQHQQSSMTSSSPYANHNSMNQAPSSMQKSMLNSTGGGVNITGNGGNGGSPFVGMQQGGGGEFARAPGPASSIMDNNMTAKPFGMANRSSTWSAFGSPAQNDSEPEWPKTTTSGISASNPIQPSNAFDLVPEFEPGKPWRGSMLMKSVEDDPTMTPGSMARSLAPQRKTIWSDDSIFN